MNIEECRKRIDLVDEQIVRLLNMRAQLAIEIGRTKREAGIELHDPVRAEEAARGVLDANPGALGAGALMLLFGAIADECRFAAEQAGIAHTKAASTKVARASVERDALARAAVQS